MISSKTIKAPPSKTVSFGGGSPLLTMTQDIAGLSTAAVPDSAFQILKGNREPEISMLLATCTDESVNPDAFSFRSGRRGLSDRPADYCGNHLCGRYRQIEAGSPKAMSFDAEDRVDELALRNPPVLARG